MRTYRGIRIRFLNRQLHKMKFQLYFITHSSLTTRSASSSNTENRSTGSAANNDAATERRYFCILHLA